MHDDKNTPPGGRDTVKGPSSRRLCVRENVIRLLARPSFLAWVVRAAVPEARALDSEALSRGISVVFVSPPMQGRPLEVFYEIWFQFVLPSRAQRYRMTLVVMNPESREVYRKAIPPGGTLPKRPWSDVDTDGQIIVGPNYFDSDSYVSFRDMMFERTEYRSSQPLETSGSCRIILMDLGDPEKVLAHFTDDADPAELAEAQALYLLDVLFNADLLLGRKMGLLVQNLGFSLPVSVGD